MNNQDKIKKELLKRSIVTPSVMCPTFGGAILLFSTLTFGFMPVPVAIFLCVAGVGASAFTAGYRLFYKNDEIAEEIAEEMKEDAEEKRKEKAQKTLDANNKRMDKLRSGLLRDGDDRTQVFLRELRELAAQFAPGGTLEEISESISGQNSIDFINVSCKVEALFETCLQSLEKTLKMQDAANRVSGKAKLLLKKQREKIVSDIEDSVERLGEILVNVTEMMVSSSGDSNLDKINAELDRELRVVKNVNEKMEAIRNPGRLTAEQQAEEDELLHMFDDQNNE